MLSYNEETKNEVLDALREQMTIEGQLIDLYDGYEKSTPNKALKRLMMMFKLDSQRHVNLIQSSIDVIEGGDIFMEDKQILGDSLSEHLSLEAEALKRADMVLGKSIVRDNEGLKGLLEIWRDDEKRHHKVLKNLVSKKYFSIDERDMVSMFRDEAFLEERYQRSKRFQQSKTQ